MMMMMAVSIGGRTITNLLFADDIDGLAGQELANLVEHLNKASTAYGMEISAEKTKLMTNNTSGITTEIKVYGQKLETAQATAALTRLKQVWIDKSISLSSKIRLMRSLVTFIFLYACESCTLTAELKKEYKPWKRGATARYYASHTKTMLPTRKYVPRSSRQLDHMKIS